MNQEEKTIELKKFWEKRRKVYEFCNDVKNTDRCNKHICQLRNDFV